MWVAVVAVRHMSDTWSVRNVVKKLLRHVMVRWHHHWRNTRQHVLYAMRRRRHPRGRVEPRGWHHHGLASANGGFLCREKYEVGSMLERVALPLRNNRKLDDKTTRGEEEVQ